MALKCSDQSAENDYLEEGEILDSDEEVKTEKRGREKSTNEQHRNRRFDQTDAVRSFRRGPVKRKRAGTPNQDRTDSTRMPAKKKKVLEHIGYNQVRNERNRNSNISPAAKGSKPQDRFRSSRQDSFPNKQKEHCSTLDVSPNENSVPKLKRSLGQRAVKVRKQFQERNKQPLFATTKSGGKVVGKKKPALENNLMQLNKKKPDSKKSVMQQRNKKIPCKFFLEGNCTKGPDCFFYHGSPHRKKFLLCKYYASGNCTKREQCPFMHEDFPCKFHHTNTICYSKEDCRFSHVPLTEEMKKLLDKYLQQNSRGKGNASSSEDCDHEQSKSVVKQEPEMKEHCLLGDPGVKPVKQEPEMKGRCLLGDPGVKPVKQEPEMKGRCLLGDPGVKPVKQEPEMKGRCLLGDPGVKPVKQEPEMKRRCLLGDPGVKPVKQEPGVKRRCLLGDPGEQRKSMKLEPETKRRCLLGEPPKEGPTTRRWREDLKKRQQEKKVFQRQSQRNPAMSCSKRSWCNSHTDKSSNSSGFKRHAPTADMNDSVSSSKSHTASYQSSRAAYTTEQSSNTSAMIEQSGNTAAMPVQSDSTATATGQLGNTSTTEKSSGTLSATEQSDNSSDWDSILAMVNNLGPAKDVKSTSGEKSNSEEKCLSDASEDTGERKSLFPAWNPQDLWDSDLKDSRKQLSGEVAPSADSSPKPQLYSSYEIPQQLFFMCSTPSKKRIPGLAENGGVQQDFYCSESDDSIKQHNGKRKFPVDVKNRKPVLSTADGPVHLPPVLTKNIKHKQKRISTEERTHYWATADTSASEKVRYSKAVSGVNKPARKSDADYSNEKGYDVSQYAANYYKELPVKCPVEGDDLVMPARSTSVDNVRVAESTERASKGFQPTVRYDTSVQWNKTSKYASVLTHTSVPPSANRNPTAIQATGQQPKKYGNPEICCDLRKCATSVPTSSMNRNPVDIEATQQQTKRSGNLENHPDPRKYATPTADSSATRNPVAIEAGLQQWKTSENPQICRDPRKCVPRDPRLRNREQTRTAGDSPSLSSLAMEGKANLGNQLSRKLGGFANCITEKSQNGENQVDKRNRNVKDPRWLRDMGKRVPKKLGGVDTMIENSALAAAVERLQYSNTMPYRLHKVSGSVPNYMLYLEEHNYDAELLSDPRIKHHIKQAEMEVSQDAPAVMPDSSNSAVVHGQCNSSEEVSSASGASTSAPKNTSLTKDVKSSDNASPSTVGYNLRKKKKVIYSS